jgi:histidinol-phosphatase (PHP family)
MLNYAKELGIPVTIGSDAHSPARLAENLEQARQCLKEAGFVQLATFERRIRTMVDF